ncbi:hypothetical protein ETU08_00300 [Apibacter muscae]|uniref:hypothetical protein n=1 Tax=Apibacter muscae TaxID=2509004 RepID=UPI0011ACEF35|nr:hypothetical protein [Apibacter muscae]TWP31811.1 hypothetical protein ETU08_00300 [Apibacter muscae]
MKVEVFMGTDPRVYEIIGPFAMDLNFIKANGYPLTTSSLHKWFVGIEDGEILCFCSVKYALTTKTMQLGNFFNLRGNKQRQLITKVIKTFTKEKQLGLNAFSNNDNLEFFYKLGFVMQTENKEWHNLKYEPKKEEE